MSADIREKETARRLVEIDGLSLAAAARRVGRNPRTLSRWARAGAAEGDAWRLRDPRSVAAFGRAAVVGPAHTAAHERWVRWAAEEGDAAGELAVETRRALMATLIEYRRAFDGGDERRAFRLATAMRPLAGTFSDAVDRADRLTAANRRRPDPLGEDEAYAAPPDPADVADQQMLLELLADVEEHDAKMFADAVEWDRAWSEQMPALLADIEAHDARMFADAAEQDRVWREECLPSLLASTDAGPDAHPPRARR